MQATPTATPTTAPGRRQRRYTAGAVKNVCSAGFHVIAWSPNGKHWLMLAQNVDETTAAAVVRWYNRRPDAAQPCVTGLEHAL